MASDADSNRLAQLESQLSASVCNSVALEPIVQDVREDARIDVFTMRYQRRSSNSVQRIEQTILCYEIERDAFPDFALYPEVSGLFGTVRQLTAPSSIHFSEPAGFSEAYRVDGAKTEAIQTLLTLNLRESLLGGMCWSIVGGGRRLFLAWPGKVASEAELPEFIQQALELVGLLFEGLQHLDEQPQIERKASTQDRVDAARAMGGLSGIAVRSQLNKIAISPKEFQDFMGAEIPRSIPRGMKQQVLGDVLPLLLVGPILALSGVVGGVITYLAVDQDLIFLTLLIPIVPVLGGLALFGFTLKFLQKKKRTLRYGELVTGRVTEVKQTSVKINDRIRYIAQVHWQGQGKSHIASCNIYGEEAERARAFVESGQQVRLLVDPDNPKHVIVADLLSVFE